MNKLIMFMKYKISVVCVVLMLILMTGICIEQVIVKKYTDNPIVSIVNVFLFIGSAVGLSCSLFGIYVWRPRLINEEYVI